MKQKEVSNLKKNTFTNFLQMKKKVSPLIVFIFKGKTYGI